MIEKTIDQAQEREGDKLINCRWKEGCNIVIIFTKRDQEFFAEKGYNEPAYCVTNGHRAKVKAAREARGNAR
jgi:hypothetical protein